MISMETSVYLGAAQTLPEGVRVLVRLQPLDCSHRDREMRSGRSSRAVALAASAAPARPAKRASVSAGEAGELQPQAKRRKHGSQGAGSRASLQTHHFVAEEDDTPAGIALCLGLHLTQLLEINRNRCWVLRTWCRGRRRKHHLNAPLVHSCALY